MKTLLATIACLFLFTGCHSHSKLKEVPTRDNEVTLRGNPVSIYGDRVEIGDTAPNFVVVGLDMKEKQLSDFAGKTIVLSVVPSVDTKVCAIQTRTFNEKAAALGKDVVILTVSKDLPMAQKRFCAAEGIKQVVMLSDYRGNFGVTWGLEIKESGLLARSLYVIDPTGEVVHAEIVPELTTEPDYDAALKAIGS